MAERRKSYAEQLKDPRWQKKRLEIMQRDDFACRNCFREDHEQLHVHHKYYKRGTMLWEYPDWSMVTLCHECHEYAQDEMEATHATIARIIDIDSLGLVRGYALGIHMRYRDHATKFDIESPGVATGIGDAFGIPYELMHNGYRKKLKVSGKVLDSIKKDERCDLLLRSKQEAKTLKVNTSPLDTDMCFV